MKKQLILINNEKVNKENCNFFCDNIFMKHIPEDLSEKFNIHMISRSSKIQRSHKINLQQIKLGNNIFSYLINILKTLKFKDAKYFVISVTPYTFFASLILILLKRQRYIYLISNGYEEYRSIFGTLGPIIFHVMFFFSTLKSKIIVCQKRISKKKSSLVFPSQLDAEWFEKIIQPPLSKPKLLYVGRIKVEKGIFSLVKILNEMDDDVELSILGKPVNEKIKSKKVNYLGYEKNSDLLKKTYDNHNIFILPSFTEGHPQALDEALARKRPVIIFDEINHVIQNRKGVFISQRNVKSLTFTIKYIMKNYFEIQKSMMKNNLPTRKKFISDLIHILS